VHKISHKPACLHSDRMHDSSSLAVSTLALIKAIFSPSLSFPPPSAFSSLLFHYSNTFSHSSSYFFYQICFCIISFTSHLLRQAFPSCYQPLPVHCFSLGPYLLYTVHPRSNKIFYNTTRERIVLQNICTSIPAFLKLFSSGEHFH